jgi:hypothetical protein
MDIPTDVYGKDIVESPGYSPHDKIALGYEESALEDESREGHHRVEAVTKRLNADWRAVYRSHLSLSLAYDALGRHEEANRHRELCLTFNPRYPC